MSVTSSHYAIGSDTYINLIAASEESNNSFIYQMVSSDTNSVYNADIEKILIKQN